MIAKYKFKKFEFHAFKNFIWDLINRFQIGQIRFSPHQGADLFNDHQLTHIGPVYNLDNPGDFLYVWSRNQNIVRSVTYDQFHKNGTPKFKVTFDLDEKTMIIESVEGIQIEVIEQSLNKFFEAKIFDTNLENISKWWKYLHPAWWILQITRIPFLLIKRAGFNINKIESSAVGKIIKLIIGAVVVFGGAILPILDAFGYRDGFVNFVKNIFKL